ncbi:MAG: transcription antitermination factor NusB [Bacteroidetes bacterium GWA2_31_9]|nr:MAG: transcription antitermination factor NusB [Bacteroidetes bacterium GWA2_31_9]
MLSRRLLRIKVMHILYAYFNAESPDFSKYEKELQYSINKSYDLYHFLLSLMLDIRRFIDLKQDQAKTKRILLDSDINPNTRFLDNKFLVQLSTNIQLRDFLNVKKLSWVNHPEIIKNLYNSIQCSEYFTEYMSLETSDYDQDKKFISNIYEHIIVNDEELYNALEEMSIYWNDDVEFVISMILKTIKSFKENDSISAKLMPLYKNTDDKEFIIQLFKKTIANSIENTKLIDSYIKNWEIDRIAFMDILIMQLAITEAVEFSSIPIKVTLNEYIDIAKFYSTAKSGTFINGVLDKIFADLKKNKKIVKRGLGLVGD